MTTYHFLLPPNHNSSPFDPSMLPLLPIRLSVVMISCSPDPYDSPNILPANRTLFHLPRTLLTGNNMSTIVEQGIHLALVAYLAQMHLLVRNLKYHMSFPMSLPLLETPSIHIAGLRVHHLPMPIGLVGFPFPSVGVPICVCHGPLPCFIACGEVARVGITG